MPKFLPILLVSLLFAGASSARSGGPTPSDVYRVLEDRGIPFDGAAVQKGAVEGMLKAIDPRARIVRSDEITNSVPKPSLGKAEEWPEGIRYLKLNGLYEDGATSVVERVRSWFTADESCLIIVLRGAGGDSLKAVDGLAGLFLPGNTELYSIRDGRRSAAKHRTPTDNPDPRNGPVMLAVDSDTKDASEILAAILKGRSRVMLIGARTRGDAALRQVLPLAGKDSIYIATRWVDLPGDGGSLTNGIEPDFAVTSYNRTALPDKAPLGRTFSEKTRKDRELMERVMNDAVLGSATDILLGLKALGFHAKGTNTSSTVGP